MISNAHYTHACPLHAHYTQQEHPTNPGRFFVSAQYFPTVRVSVERFLKKSSFNSQFLKSMPTTPSKNIPQTLDVFFLNFCAVLSDAHNTPQNPGHFFVSVQYFETPQNPQRFFVSVQYFETPSAPTQNPGHFFVSVQYFETPTTPHKTLDVFHFCAVL